MYGKIDIGVNSDIDQPVVATITSGPLSGARLVGKYNLSNNQMSVTFNSINFGGPTGSIEAIALDGDTAEAAIQGSRDYHIVQRYGLTFLTGFMSGLGSAITSNASSTTTTTTSDASSSTTTSTNSNDYDWEEYALSGLGQAGTDLSNNLDQLQNDIPTLTVTLEAGKMIGVLLTSDYTVGTS